MLLFISMSQLNQFPFSRGCHLVNVCLKRSGSLARPLSAMERVTRLACSGARLSSSPSSSRLPSSRRLVSLE